MKRLLPVLAVLLLVQVGLAVTLEFGGEDFGAFRSDENLLDVDMGLVDRIELQEGEDAALNLELQEGAWILPGRESFPASPERVSTLTAKLAELKRTWPVATTPSAAGRFRVARDEFENRITLKHGDDVLATLYLGTSPGFRKVHARVEGQDEIYAIPFSSYEAGADVDDWIDKDLLHLDRNKIVGVQMPSFSLRREGDQLVVVDTGEDEEVRTDEVDTFIRALAAPTFMSVLGVEALPEYRQSAPDLEVTLQLEPDQSITYTYSRPEDESYYVLKSSEHPWYFKVSEYSVDRLKEVTRDQLIEQKEVPDAPIDEPAPKQNVNPDE